MLPPNLVVYRRPEDWRSVPPAGDTLQATVLFPVFNVVANLRHTLESLAQQSIPGKTFEVLMVDNGSQDAVLDMLQSREWPFSVRYYFQSRAHRQSGKCRNIGIANAHADLVVMLDADCLCGNRFLEHHLRLHQRELKCYVIGDIRALDEHRCLDRTVPITLEVLRRAWLPGQATWKGRLRVQTCFWLRHWSCAGRAKMNYWLSGGNSSVKGVHLLEAGGYDETFDKYWGDEDAELGYRLEKRGIAPRFSYEALVYHQWHPSSRLGSPCRNRLLLLMKHPELARARLLMREINRYYRKTPAELEALFHDARE